MDVVGTRAEGFVVARLVPVAILVVVAMGSVGCVGYAASPDVGEQARPPRLSAEAFFPRGAGLRVYLTPHAALTAQIESRSDGTQEAYARAGVALVSPRPFYEWQTYAVTGMSYRIPAGGAGQGVWRPFMAVGGQFEILFLEYHLMVDRAPIGWFRYGVRIFI